MRLGRAISCVGCALLLLLVFGDRCVEAADYGSISLEPDPTQLLVLDFRIRRRTLILAHRPRGYREARHFLFSTLDNVQGEVEGVYSGLRLRTRGIPNARIMNTEHTWPKSWFRRRLPPNKVALARCDLHHLFPTLTRLNSIRGSLPFGMVSRSVHPLRGGSRCDGRRFEPRDCVKGDIARAMLYFSARYDLSIPYAQERVLRGWHRADPVSPKEIRRNRLIYQFQGTHNPFVRFPDMASFIQDF